MRGPRTLFSNLFLFGLLATPAVGQVPGINWQSDVESARALAGQTNRLVLVHVWTTNCGPCLALEQNVFSQPGIAPAIEGRFVPVKMNADEHPEIAQQLGISRVPTDVILTPKGQVIARLISPSTPSAYVAEIGQVATRYSQELGKNYDQAVASAPQPSQMNSAYANLQVGTTPAAVQSAQQQQQGTPAGPNMAFVSMNQGTPPPAGTPSQPAYNPSQVASQVASATPPSYSPGQTPTPPADRYAGVQNNGPAPKTYTNGHPQVTTPSGYNPVSPQVASIENPHVAPSYGGPSGSRVASQSPLASPNGPTFPQPTQTAASVNRYSPDATTPVAGNGSTQVARPGNEAGVMLPEGVPPLGFEGFCTVSMRKTWQWIPGNPKWGAIHRGRTYVFANQEARDEFLRNPDFYAPALSGIDPVLAMEKNQMVPGRREHSLDYDSQFFFFASEATLEQFRKNPERYVQGVRQAMGLGPAAVR